jgi:predicted transcriptional regulator YheO
MGQTGTPGLYAEVVPRQRYAPESAEDAARAARVAELYQAWKHAEDEYKQALSEVARPAGPIAISYLAELLGIERKTVYRHLGRSMN